MGIRKIRIILGYHRVNDDRDLPINLRAADFEAQLRRLRDGGFESVRLADFQRYYVSGGAAALPPRTVVFTFDDGYLDNYTTDAPLLRKYGFTGTFFIPTAHTGTNKILPHDALKGGSEATDLVMSWEQARELLEAGMDIGGHTMHHTVLTDVDAETAWREIRGCMDDLENHFGAMQYFFCYPKNAYNMEVREMVRRAGFAGAALTPSFQSRVPDRDPFLMRRTGIQRHNTDWIFGLKAYCWYDLFRSAWWRLSLKHIRK